MRRSVFTVVAVLLLGAFGTSTWAFECPARIAEAKAAIKTAEASVMKIADAKAKGNAQGMLEAAKDMVKEAQEYHDKGVAKKSAAEHYEAAAWAKAAKWLADQAKAGM